MKKPIIALVIILLLVAGVVIFLSVPKQPEQIDLKKMNQTQRVEWFKHASNEERAQVLTPQQYHVIVNKQMEASFLGNLNNNDKEGEYYSAVCDYQVFSSEDKFDGQSGYVDFEDANMNTVQFKEHPRTEQIQVYSICGEYLGYVIMDESRETGRHFIINSVALTFKKT